MPLLGPAIGPIIGGFIAETTTWRWLFYATSAASLLVSVSGVFWLEETYAPRILELKAQRLRTETGNRSYEAEGAVARVPLHQKLALNLNRPFVLLGSQMLIQVIATYMAFLYGVLYLVLSTFSDTWTTVYGEALGIGSLNYISLAIGLLLGTQIGAPLNDRVCCLRCEAQFQQTDCSMA